MPTPRKLQRGTWLAIVLLIASGMVIAIGVAAGLQHAHDRKVATARAHAFTEYGSCISAWGTKLVHGINATRALRADYDEAAARRDDAVADVLRVVIGLRVDPPVATDDELTDALEHARLADDKADAARHDLKVSLQRRGKYQPPTLTCGATP